MNKLRLVLLVSSLALLGQCRSDYIAGETLSKGKLAFVANPSGNWELFLLTAGQTTPVQLTHTLLDERAPAISPDGTQIAYATSDGSLWLMTIATKQSQQIAGPPGHYGYPTWGPAGSSLIYTVYSFTPPTEDADLYMYSFPDKKQTLLVQQTGPQDFPAMSPTDDRLAYMSSVATLIPGFGSTVTQQLWVVSLRDGKPRQLFSGSFRETKPSWSPDGKWLAFSSDRNGTPEIWIADSQEAQVPIQVSSGPGAKTSPTWSPDGKEIAFVSTVSGHSQLMVVDVKSKRFRILVYQSKVEFKDPTWR